MRWWHIVLVIELVMALTFYGYLFHQHNVEMDEVIMNRTEWEDIDFEAWEGE